MTTDKDCEQADVIDMVRGDGPWQRMIYFVCFFCIFPVASHQFVISFYAPNLDHWCSRPSGSNITVEEWKSLALPPSDPRCSRYEFANLSSVLKGNFSHHERRILPCSSWEYDESIYYSTILSKWNLVCGKKWLVSLLKSIFVGGYIPSLMVFGYLSDRYGRKPIIAICNIIAVVSSILCAFSTSFTMFAVLRYFIAVGTANVYNTAFILLMEVVGPEYRSIYGVGLNFGWSFGYVTLPGIVWLLRDWFWVQIVITIPSIFLLSSWWTLPESPRWLLTQGKTNEAKEILLKAANKNGTHHVTCQEIEKKISFSETKRTQDQESSSALDLLRTPGLWQKSLNVFYLWGIIAFMYFGLSFNTNELAGDPFINFFVSGLIEMPANVVSMFIINSYGRRNPVSGFLMIGALACLAMYFVPQDPWWISVLVSNVGKFCISSVFCIMYVYTAEIFPTVLRNVGLGSASLSARVGSLLAPFVRELGHATHPVVPQIIFGVLAAIGSLLVLLLPETNHCRVPDTVLEAAQVTRRKVQSENSVMMKEMQSERF